MAVNRDPVLKRCRALDLDPVYLGYSKKSKRNPQRSHKKMSEYGLQLREKQKVKRAYGMGAQEKQFKSYYTLAAKQQGITGAYMLSLLERRLDNVVYRMGIGDSRAQARQFVMHGHITVNGKKVDIPSYRVSVGEEIAVK